MLLSRKTSEAEKRRILQDDYDIQMTRTLESEVSVMCNLSKGVMEKGRKKGMEKGLKQGILSSIKSLRSIVQPIISITTLLKLRITNAAISVFSSFEYYNHFIESHVSPPPGFV